MVYRSIKKKRLNELKKAYRKMGTVAWKTRDILRQAVASGRIKKPFICSKCLKEYLKKIKIEGHHSDYKQPLKVIWLCGECHREIHKELFVIKGGKRRTGKP